MFFACEVWCIADVSIVSPSSEQTTTNTTPDPNPNQNYQQLDSIPFNVFTVYKLQMASTVVGECIDRLRMRN